MTERERQRGLCHFSTVRIVAQMPPNGPVSAVATVGLLPLIKKFIKKGIRSIEEKKRQSVRSIEEKDGVQEASKRKRDRDRQLLDS